MYDGAGIADAILSNDVAAYRCIFGEWFAAKMEHDVVAATMSGFGDRVKHAGDKYVVDGMWAVTKKGRALYWHNGKWCNLCLVSVGTEARDVVLPGRDRPVRVNARTWVVVGKLIFLLFPRPEPVFMRQLPVQLRARVSELHEAFCAT